MALLALAAASYAFAIRPRMLRWGATDDEVSRPYPSAGIAPGGRRSATMATTIDAPPSGVWPWLAQMGCDRAGWYSWDRLDNAAVPSAERIHPEWCDLSVGDRLASTPSGSTWFEVAAVEPERFLALRASLDIRGRPYDTDGPHPWVYSDSTWCFLLEELPGRRTRLVVSGYAVARPRFLATIMNALFWEPAHWIMQTRQFANLERRAAGLADAERKRQPDHDGRARDRAGRRVGATARREGLRRQLDKDEREHRACGKRE
jgi:proline iminopeptidase